jgi:two-component sensor histidine kinase
MMFMNHPDAPSPAPVDLAAEADHRIANHLTMVNGICRIQASALRRRREPLTGAEAGAILDGIGAKVQAISLLHRRLARAEAESAVPLCQYLRELLTGITEALADGTLVEFEVIGDRDCVVDSKRTVTIGLIVCELVTNAMKHAHPSGVPGRLWVRCGGEHAVAVEIEDDGVGLPDDFDPETSNGLGFSTIRAMVSQIGATLTFRNTGLGVVARLEMPADRRQ